MPSVVDTSITTDNLPPSSGAASPAAQAGEATKELAHQHEREPEPVREITAEFFEAGRILDGDTFKVFYDGDITSVRIMDINAPERGDPLAPAATEELRRLIEGQTVRLEFAAARRRDSFGRLLCRVYVDGLNVGQHLLDHGFVSPYLPGPRKTNAK